MPITERRRPLRRSLLGGLVLGAFAAPVAMAVECAYVSIVDRAAFDNFFERAQFVLCSLGVAAAAGALAGLLLGGLFAATDAVAQRAPRKRQSIWKARLLTAWATPLAALVSSQMFAGRHARELPGGRLLPVAAGLAGLALLYLVARAGYTLVERAAIRPGRRAGALPAALALVAAAAALYLVDARALPRLYPYFHLTLGALQFGCALAACGLVYLAAQRAGSRLGRLAAPRAALAVAVAAVAAGAFGLRGFARHEPLRAAVYQHTVLAAPLVETARAAGLARAVVPPPPPPPPLPATVAALPPGPVLADRDVFLITVDAMRADRLDPRTAPHLAALAARGVRFTHAYAQVPHTSFSLASLLTGKFVYALSALGGDAAAHETLADVFQRDRYKTAAFFPPSVFFIDHDRFRAVERGAYHFEYVKYEHMGARGRTDQVIRFLDEEKPRRAFVWVHYFEPHEPYDLHPGVRPDATAVERYDGEVSFVDGEIARLLDYLAKTRPNAIVAFTADHGEEFGEHGGRYHGTTLYEEQVHVPLFIATPGLPARAVDGPVALVDVAPTLLALAGITPSAKMRGQDLGPWLSAKGADPARLGPAFAEIGSRKLIAVGSDRLICDVARDTCELYDLAADPEERRNLAGRPPHDERARALQAELARWLDAQSAFERAPAGEDAAERAKRALERGRLGERAAARDVAALLADEKFVAEAAEVLLGLPADPATAPAIAQARVAAPDDRALQVLALRLAPDRALAERVAAWAAGDGVTPRLRAEAALALAPVDGARAVPLLARALAEAPPQRSDDDPRGPPPPPAPGAIGEELEVALIAALGRSHDRRAEAPLVAHLDGVRTRLEVVRALGELPAKGAAPRLARAVADEPYVSVRAEMARVLGALGDRAAAPALARLLAVEKEPLVAGEAAAALARLGAAHPLGGRGWACDRHGCLPAAGALVPTAARAGDTLWLVPADGASGALEVGGVRVDIGGDARAFAATATADGRAAVTLVAGEPRLRAVVIQAKR